MESITDEDVKMFREVSENLQGCMKKHDRFKCQGCKYFNDCFKTLNESVASLAFWLAQFIEGFQSAKKECGIEIENEKEKKTLGAGILYS